MYKVVTPGMGAALGPWQSYLATHPKAQYLAAHPRVRAYLAQQHPVVAAAIRRKLGLGCPCAGIAGCGCAGMGQSVSNIPGDIGTVLSDIFLNSDGSVNWIAVGFAGVAGLLIVANWGHTTRRRK